ncbi:GDSL-type esterase/lipase family protein [Streptomyces sp. NBC_00019]|uniref:golvesin C-terminal-like domain-containing protein n=1 Tax=Streptomyces sp. NBC_00019 TaxID=2975623 RepID=UPI0032528208
MPVIMGLLLAVAAGGLGTSPADAKEAVPTGAAEAPSQEAGPKPSAVPRGERAELLGSDYKESEDRAFTTSGDALGFHVMVADEKNGYAWRTAASLAEPGFETDTWIGNACVTASGRYAAVAYAPRTFTNKPELMSRGAFTAIVDLTSGAVRKLPFQATLGYFSPGCGTGDQAVFSQFTDELSSAKSETRLITADARNGRTEKAKITGQVTSAVPVADGRIVAARGREVVRIDGSAVRTVARTHAVPFQLMPDADGGVTFIDRLPGGGKKKSASGKESASDQAAVSRVTAAEVRSAGAKAKAKTNPKATQLAQGDLTAFDLARTPGGQVFVTGKAKSGARLPGAVRNPGGIDKDARVSSAGAATLTTAWADGKDSRVSQEDALAARPARITLKALDTGTTTVLDALPGVRVGSTKAQQTSTAISPALPKPTKADGASASGQMSVMASPIDADRTCSVPRGNVKLQAFQPTPRQIEWAVDQAVVDNLNSGASRSANWKNTGINVSYAPQSLFPLRELTGGSGADWHIPAQILLGITAQESNMWQATRFAVPGVSANPLIGNFYGVDYAPNGDQPDPWAINWADSDCGYGVTQVTDGMRLPGNGQPTMTELQQRAVAVDYAANIAKGADILADKWNQTRADGLVINNGEPRWIENWFYALWAYNSGYYPRSAAAANSGKWGVGWTNNPANPLWKENRTPFLENASGEADYDHARNPQFWPYPEKVIGWAARPLFAMTAPGEFAAGYRPSYWNNDAFKTDAKPPIGLFCSGMVNDCDPTLIENDNEQENGPCLLPTDDNDPLFLKCWYHGPAIWKECGPSLRECGYPQHRFDTTYPEQPDGTAYPPRCTAGLPGGTLIVDDVAEGITPMGGAGRSCGASTSAGSFSFDFPSPSGRMDLHQLGAGYDNHFWFSHTYRQPSSEPPKPKVTGTWTLRPEARGWMRVWVHVPDHGAHTRQASYTVLGTDSTSPTRVKPQRVMSNKWLSLGAFNFVDTPQVRLSNITKDGNGTEDVAWDAVGFEPLGGKPANQIVAMGDSFSSGEGVTVKAGDDYYPESDYYNESNPATKNACHRSTKAWSRVATLPLYANSIGKMADSRSPDMDYQFIACSGAQHYNILNRSKNSELPQIKQGYLDQNTTLVTLSIGGNDSGFGPIIEHCLIGTFTEDCQKDPTGIPAWDPDTGAETGGTTGRLSEWVPNWIRNEIRPRLTATLRAIHEQAPNARIVLMGYPALLDPDQSCSSPPLVNDSETIWLNGVADRLATQMSAAVADANSQYLANAVFADPRAAFAGRAICSTTPANEAIHGVVLIDHSKADSSGASMKSFHPNIAGAQLYAGVLEQALTQP